MNISIHNISEFKIGETQNFQSGGQTIHVIHIKVKYFNHEGKEITQEISFYSESPIFDENIEDS